MLHIQKEGKWERYGGILEARPGNMEMVHITSIHIDQIECSHTPSLKGRILLIIKNQKGRKFIIFIKRRRHYRECKGGNRDPDGYLRHKRER